MHNLGGNKFAFKSHHNKWLVAESNGTINCNRDQMGPYERFELIRMVPFVLGEYYVKSWKGMLVVYDDG